MVTESAAIYPYVRDRSEVLTLAQAAKTTEKRSPRRYVTCRTSEIAVQVADKTFTAPGIEDGLLGEDGIDVLAGWLSVPTQFLDRLDPDLQQRILDRLLSREDGEVQLGIAPSGAGIREAVSPAAKVIPLASLFEVAINVMGEGAEVVDCWAETGEFRLDVIVPEGHDLIGGDPKVGDLTRAGVRFTQDRKKNLAPMVSGYFHRLVCTNGMEDLDTAFRLRGRATTIEEMLAELESNSKALLARSQDRMKAFYDMRTEKVDRPLAFVTRLCLDAGISPRLTTAIIDAMAVYPEDEITRFDLVNLVTHMARAPKIKSGPQRKLELVGGELIADHYRRCTSCFHRLDEKVGTA